MSSRAKKRATGYVMRPKHNGFAEGLGPGRAKAEGKEPVFGTDGEPLNRAARRARKRMQRRLRR